MAGEHGSIIPTSGGLQQASVDNSLEVSKDLASSGQVKQTRRSSGAGRKLARSGKRRKKR